MKVPKWVIVFICLQILLFSVLVWLIIKNPTVKEYITIEAEATEQIPGEDGKDGYTPIKGVDYFDGIDGKDSLSTHTIVERETAIKGDKGDTGEPGEQGHPGQEGKSIELRCRDFSSKLSQIQQRYVGDEAWSLLYEIPHKCTGEIDG